MLHAILLFRALRVVETVQGADKIARDTADALKLHALADKTDSIRYADTFHFLTPS